LEIAMSIAARLVPVLLLAALSACSTVNPTATNARDWLIQYRTGNGLTPVSLDPRLTALARAQADAMASQDRLSHDVDGSFSDRVVKAGLAQGKIAENVAYGATTEAGVMDQWRHSPGHDKNLLMPGATRFGIASAQSKGPKKRVYWAMAIAADPPKPVATILTAGSVEGRIVEERVSPAARGPGLGSSLMAPFAALFGK
jgi:hypothetical protein